METNLQVPVTTVQHNGTSKFKYTITTDNQVRIKIPDRFVGTDFEQDWIDVCNEITGTLALIPRETTLRGRTNDASGGKNNPTIHLRKKAKNRNNPIVYSYEVFNKKLIKKEEKWKN